MKNHTFLPAGITCWQFLCCPPNTKRKTSDEKQPVITIITSFLVLKEQLTVLTVLGTLLTLTGLFISEHRMH
ncbi:MAG: EamA family transporter [Lachnospiraceae bacterium]|nr:EamA family transporter [Lachnospiraceae bacterium]